MATKQVVKKSNGNGNGNGDTESPDAPEAVPEVEEPMTTEDPAAKAQATTLKPAVVNPATLLPINTNPSPRGSHPNLGMSMRTPGGAAFVSRVMTPVPPPTAPTPQGDIGTVTLEEEPDDEAKKFQAKQEALAKQNEDDAAKILDEEGFLLPLKEQIATGAKTVITHLAGPVFINGKRYGPGRNVSVPADAYSSWKEQVDWAANEADQASFRTQREGAAPVAPAAPMSEMDMKRAENRQASEIDGITRSHT